MKWTVIGLGNPGSEYEMTPHNVGQEALEYFVKKNDGTDWAPQSKAQSHTAQVKLGTANIACVIPQTFMNNSGIAGAYFAKSKKDIAQCIVIHDDLDLPLGSIKLVFARGSGGHRGVESLNKAWKTDAYIRIRIGVCPATPSGKPKKPSGEDAVVKYILKPLKDAQYALMKKTYKAVGDAIVAIITDGLQGAMNHHNTRL